MANAAAYGGGQLVRHIAKHQGKKHSGSSGRTNDGNIMTNQFDTSLTYKRKKKGMSKGRKFQIKVRNAIAHNLGKNIFSRVVNWDGANSVGQQNAIGFSLYGGYQGSTYFDDDMWDLFKGLFGSPQFTGVSNNRAMLTSAILDLTFCNPSSQTNTMILDAYVCIPKKDIGDSNIGSATNLFSLWGNAQSGQSGLLNASSLTEPSGQQHQAPVAQIIGTSPFSSAQFCTLITILEKRSFILTPGQTATMQIKQMRKGLVQAIDYTGVLYRKGWSKIVMLVWRGINTSTTGVTTMATAYPAVSLNVWATKTYTAEVLTDQTDAMTQAQQTT